MVLGEYMASLFSPVQNLEFCLRMVAACFCGSLIGLERSRRFKGAGVRTHILVCMGAALVMIVSKYGFADLTDPAGVAFGGTRGADPARIAAQVISGISFLCAGVILKNGNFTVRGLTTAAGVWLTAVIGLSLGAGMYFIGIFATALELFLQFIMHRIPMATDSWSLSDMRLVVKEDFEFNRVLNDQLALWDAVIAESRIIRRGDGKLEYELSIRTREELTFEAFEAFVNGHDEIISGSNMPVR